MYKIFIGEHRLFCNVILVEISLFFKFSPVSNSIKKIYSYYQKSQHWKEKIAIYEFKKFHAVIS